jgi:hypothetical protein
MIETLFLIAIVIFLIIASSGRAEKSDYQD